MLQLFSKKITPATFFLKKHLPICSNVFLICHFLKY